MSNTSAPLLPAPAQFKLERINRIIELHHPDHLSPENMRHVQGQFVPTDPRSGPVNQKIGYCMQISNGVRKSDRPTELLRQADGSVSAQPYQSLFALLAEQEVLASRIFNAILRDENLKKVIPAQNGASVLTQAVLT